MLTNINFLTKTLKSALYPSHRDENTRYDIHSMSKLCLCRLRDLGDVGTFFFFCKKRAALRSKFHWLIYFAHNKFANNNIVQKWLAISATVYNTMFGNSLKDVCPSHFSIKCLCPTLFPAKSFATWITFIAHMSFQFKGSHF